MNQWAIQTRGLTRYFHNTCAVDQITLSVPCGSVFALLGRNGSGKTTLVRMLMGLLEPTCGSATVLEEDCRRLSPAALGRTGYVAEGHPLVDWMRVRDLERFQKSFYPQWDGRMFKTVTEHFRLFANARAGHLSRGQRAGLSLALVLATRPELLVMDDPALGLDPVARRTLLEAIILVTRDAGHTIFFTSHELADVERVADHIAILDHSVLRVSCPVDTFRARVKRLVLNFSGDPPAVVNMPGLLEAQRDAHELRLTLANMQPPDEQAVAALQPLSVHEAPLSLEDAVVAYLGERGERRSLFQDAEGIR